MVKIYVIVVYDVKENKVSKVCKYLRQHLHWIQNSVFEGEITKGEFQKIKLDLKKIINLKEDSILFFTVPDQKRITKEILGSEKAPISRVI